MNSAFVGVAGTELEPPKSVRCLALLLFPNAPPPPPPLPAPPLLCAEKPKPGVPALPGGAEVPPPRTALDAPLTLLAPVSARPAETAPGCPLSALRPASLSSFSPRRKAVLGRDRSIARARALLYGVCPAAFLTLTSGVSPLLPRLLGLPPSRVGVKGPGPPCCCCLRIMLDGDACESSDATHGACPFAAQR